VHNVQYVKRAYAYDFPLDTFSCGGRPSKDTRADRDVTQGTPTDETDGQQRLDAVAEEERESLGRTETWGTPESESKVQSTDVNEQRTTA